MEVRNGDEKSLFCTFFSITTNEKVYMGPGPVYRFQQSCRKNPSKYPVPLIRVAILFVFEMRTKREIERERESRKQRNMSSF